MLLPIKSQHAAASSSSRRLVWSCCVSSCGRQGAGRPPFKSTQVTCVLPGKSQIPRPRCLCMPASHLYGTTAARTPNGASNQALCLRALRSRAGKQHESKVGFGVGSFKSANATASGIRAARQLNFVSEPKGKKEEFSWNRRVGKALQNVCTRIQVGMQKGTSRAGAARVGSLPHAARRQGALKCNCCFTTRAVHRDFPGKERTPYHLLPPTHSSLIKPSLYGRRGGEKSFQPAET